jgi:AcrR family transcriptional regulator
MSERHRQARRSEVERNDQALLRAARLVVAEDGARASVASIAARAGVGIGSLYRRYPTKAALFQHLCRLSLDEYLAAAEAGLANRDPWHGFAQYVTAASLMGTGSLGPIAGTIEVTPEMASTSARGDVVAGRVIDRARKAGVLRSDVNDVDIALLIEQLGRSPVVEQLARQGRTDLLDAARRARERLIRIALDGLRADPGDTLPVPAPEWTLFTERWKRRDDAETDHGS